MSCVKSIYTAVGGDQNKEFRGNASFFEGKGAKAWNKNLLLLYFSYWPESQTGFVYIPPTTYTTHMRISELGTPVYSSLLEIT